MGLHDDAVWFDSSMYSVSPSHAVHVRSCVTHGGLVTYWPAGQVCHGVHSGALGAFENVPSVHDAHSRGPPLLGPEITYWPATH